MTITKQTVADKIAAYLHHEISLAQLVDWAENAMMDGEFFSERETYALRGVVSRLGVADVRAFGLSWEELRAVSAQAWLRRARGRRGCVIYFGFP